MLRIACENWKPFFKMEFFPSKKIGQADRLSWLTPKLSEPLKETVIAALSTEMEIKKTYFAIQCTNYQ